MGPKVWTQTFPLSLAVRASGLDTDEYLLGFPLVELTTQGSL
jgi:hypothetical protein